MHVKKSKCGIYVRVYSPKEAQIMSRFPLKRERERERRTGGCWHGTSYCIQFRTKWLSFNYHSPRICFIYTDKRGPCLSRYAFIINSILDKQFNFCFIIFSLLQFPIHGYLHSSQSAYQIFALINHKLKTKINANENFASQVHLHLLLHITDSSFSSEKCKVKGHKSIIYFMK